MLSLALIGLAGSFGALLVGCLVVVVHGLYLARHLFTLFRFLRQTKLEWFLNAFLLMIKDLGKVRLSTTTPMPPFWIAVSMATAITSNLESSIEPSLSFVFFSFQAKPLEHKNKGKK